MTDAAWVALGVAAVAALTDWYAVARDNRRLEYIAKPLTMAALAVVAATLDPADPTRRLWFTAAVVFSLAGDVFLMLPRDRFLPGVGAFLVGHLCYVGGLLRGELSTPGLLLGTGVLLVALVVTGRPLLLALQRRHRDLLVPVAVYMTAISAMVVLAIAVGPPAAAAGAVLFAFSDSVLARDRFVRSIPRASLIVMITYHLGQAGLVLSLVTPA
jgi:uncharacterized membrane protein YhhN